MPEERALSDSPKKWISLRGSGQCVGYLKQLAHCGMCVGHGVLGNVDASKATVINDFAKVVQQESLSTSHVQDRGRRS